MTTADSLSPGDLLLAWGEAAKIGHFGAMSEIAARPDCPEVLRLLAGLGHHDEVLAGLARNPTLAPGMIDTLLRCSAHQDVCDALAGNPALSAEQLLRLFENGRGLSEATRIAAMRNPRADEAVVLAAIAAGPLSDAICDEVWPSVGATTAIASAVLAQSHAGLSRETVRVFALAAGAIRLANAVATAQFLSDARSCLVAAMGDGIPPFELQQALDAIKMADAALDHLLYDRRRGPPAPLQVWW
jgi:hypothetical protein